MQKTKRQAQGKHEGNYYRLQGAMTTEGKPVFWLLWLSSGDNTGQYASASEARRAGDGIVENCLNNPKLNAAKL